MKNEPDYGYFGKGTTGYVHYMETYKQCHPDIDANLFSGINCTKLTDFMFWAIAKLGPFFFAGFFVFVLISNQIAPSDDFVRGVVISIVGFISSMILAVMLKDMRL